MAKYLSKNCTDKKLLGEIKTEAKKNSVIIAQFKNGGLKSSKKSRMKFISYKNQSIKDSKRIVVANTNRLSYVGSNYETDLSKITSSVLKICVLKMKSDTFNLYDADFFHLKPQIKCAEIIDMKMDKTYAEKSTDLTITFGSKIQQKRMNSKIKYAAEATSSNDSFVNTMNSVLDADLVQKEMKIPEEISMCSIIPPQNNSATTADDVYNIFDIIPKDEYDMLDSEAQVFLMATHGDVLLWKKENKYPDFIIQFMENNSLPINVQKAKCLCYLNFMFCFLRTNYTDWKKKDPVPSVPQPFKERLMNHFTMKKQMSMRLKDKMLAYTLVLALKLNEFVVNGNAFASSSKIAMKRITTVAYALGCHVSGNKPDQPKIIKLKIPLYKFVEVPRKKFKK